MKGILKLIKSLTANNRPAEIGLAVAFAWLLALIPGGNLTGLTLFILTFFIRLNSVALFLLIGLFNLFAFVLDPLLHEWGYALLAWEPWKMLVETLHSTTIGTWFKLNNTLVTGGLALGLLSFVPVLLLSILLVKLFRFKLGPLLARAGVIQFVLRLPLIKQIYGLTQKAQRLME